jgi:prolyl 4-hydroxylase
MKNGIIVLLLLIILYQNINKNINTEKLSNEPLANISNVTDKFFDDNSPVNVLEHFISSNEANQLIKLGNDRFKRSTVVAEQNIDDGRTSSTAHFERAENDLIKKIENKVAQMLKINPNQIEPLQLQRYRKGQQYMPHFDLLDEGNNTTPDREHTVIMYLNDMEVNEGGSTFFPIYKIRVFPRKGRAIHFRNMRTNGDKNLDTLHGGDPILGNKPKYILTAWTRNHEY